MTTLCNAHLTSRFNPPKNSAMNALSPFYRRGVCSAGVSNLHGAQSHVFSKPRAVSVGIRYEEVLLERRFPGLGWDISTNAHGKRKPVPLGLEYTAF